MVTQVTNMGRSGLSDWLYQRVSALVLAAYAIFLIAYLALNPELQYAQWKDLFSQLWMRVFSLLALLSIAVHAWIGLWVVLTDYITRSLLGSKAVALRLFLLLVYGVVTAAYVVWGVQILWGF